MVKKLYLYILLSNMVVNSRRNSCNLQLVSPGECDQDRGREAGEYRFSLYLMLLRLKIKLFKNFNVIEKIKLGVLK